MSRYINRKITAVLAIACMLLLLSPVVFATPSVKIVTEGLKSFHVRANIVEEGGVAGHGAKNGRVQILIGEIEPELYSYKFQINFRKANPNTEYELAMWCQLDNIGFTIFGNNENPTWLFIEWFANNYDIDTDGPGNGQITTTLGELGLTGETFDLITPETITTDERGSYKNIKSGLMTEDNAMEYVLDLIWPFFSQYIMDRIDGLVLDAEVDFVNLGIIGLLIHGGTYDFAMGGEFVNEVHGSYETEDIIFTHTMNDYHWGVTS